MYRLNKSREEVNEILKRRSLQIIKGGIKNLGTETETTSTATDVDPDMRGWLETQGVRFTYIRRHESGTSQPTGADLVVARIMNAPTQPRQQEDW